MQVWGCWRVCAEGELSCLCLQLYSSLFCLWAAHGGMLFGFRASSGVCVLFKPFSFSTVIILSREVSLVS